MKQRLVERDAEFTDTALVNVFRELEFEKLIRRIRIPESNRYSDIQLIDTGDYEDPFVDGDKLPEPRRLKDLQQSMNATESRFEQIMNLINYLELPEKLMLAGMLVDQTAGEVEDTYTKLRDAMNGI